MAIKTFILLDPNDLLNFCVFFQHILDAGRECIDKLRSFSAEELKTYKTEFTWGGWADEEPSLKRTASSSGPPLKRHRGPLREMSMDPEVLVMDWLSAGNAKADDANLEPLPLVYFIDFCSARYLTTAPFLLHRHDSSENFSGLDVSPDGDL